MWRHRDIKDCHESFKNAYLNDFFGQIALNWNIFNLGLSVFVKHIEYKNYIRIIILILTYQLKLNPFYALIFKQ